MSFIRKFEVGSGITQAILVKTSPDIKVTKLIKESESGLKMEIGDRWSQICAYWVSVQMSEILDFLQIAVFKFLNSGQNLEF